MILKYCLVAAVSLLVCVASACNRGGKQTAGTRVFEGTGVVQHVDREGGQIEIDHGDIKDYMPAMSMPYKTRDKSLLEKVSVGDKVRFKIEDSGAGPLLIEIEKQPS